MDKGEGEMSSNRFNTWGYVREERGRIETHNYPVLESLEETWGGISADYGSLITRDDDERTAETPLNAFLFLIDSGFYPPPEILLAVAQCFEHYQGCAGDVDLEDVFFGERKKGVGNYAARKSRDFLYRYLWFLETLECMPGKKDLPKKPLAELADGMFQHFKISEYDVDSFLRSYRRWKKRWQTTRGAV
jgi:hypothetical protein